jgi:hypothetical protein
MDPSLVNTPDPNQPNGAAILAGAQNAQAAPNAPAPEQQASPMIPQQQPQALPINPALAHAAKAGLGWHALMGTHTEFEDTPNGPVAKQAQNTPGQLFRSILSGAIMGAAAGAQNGESGSGWAAAGRGAGAAQQGAIQEQQRQQQEAQQEFQNKQEVDKAAQQKMLINAQLANMQSETAVRQHTVDLEDKKYHDAHNAASQALLSGLEAAGGVAPVDGKIAESITVPDLVQAYTKDPSIRQAPSGYFRHFIDTTDSSELTYNGEHWVHADGTPANLTNSSTVRVMDVPANAMTTKRPMTGAELNKISGQSLFKPDQTYQVSPIDMDAMNTTRLKNENESARTRQADRQLSIASRANQLEAERQRHAEFDAQRVPIAARKDTLKAQLTAMNNDLSSTPADKQAVQSQIDVLDQQLKDLADQEYPRTGKGKTAEPTKVAAKEAAADPIQATADTLKGKTPHEVKQALDDPKNGVPEAVKPQIWKKLGMSPPSALSPLGQGVAGFVKKAAQVATTGVVTP